MIHLQSRLDGAKGFETCRALRWPDSVRCVRCDSSEVTQHGRDDTQPERQRYLCQSCRRHFDNVTDIVFASQHHPRRGWIVCLYFLGLNLSHAPRATELERNQLDVQQMTGQVRHGMVARKPPPTFRDTVECDEVSMVAGHKGKSHAITQEGDADGADGSRASGDEGRLLPRSRRLLG